MNTILKMNRVAKINKPKHIKIFPEITENKYILKFDGCSKGNPGLAGAGAVIYYNNNELWSCSKFIGINVTNNQAEYHGLILGLQHAIKENIQLIKVYGDSQLIIKQMNGEYTVKSPLLIPLYEEVKMLEPYFISITYEHIYRIDNTRADELANAAAAIPLMLPSL